jgi:hypothetical protein
MSAQHSAAQHQKETEKLRGEVASLRTALQSAEQKRDEAR